MTQTAPRPATAPQPATAPRPVAAPRAGAAGARPVAPPRSPRRGLALDEVALDGGFWGTLQETNAAATLEHCAAWMERLGWVENFDRVARGTTSAERPGWQFSDSEVYKLLEAAAWEHGRTGDPAADALFRALSARVVAAQDADGYLNTCFGHPGRPGRWSDLESGHELYCVGHLLQAAVARLRTAGPDPLVEAARRAADLVCEVFGPDGREAVCGHPEVEVGLAELGRALGEPRYTAQAALFVERRGRGLLGPIPLLGPAYFQDDVPVREAEVWVGHAVRALYLAAAAVDVAVDTDDAELLAAVERQWTRSVGRRTHLTGGMGSRHQDEGFGEDWELPADRAYCETCAGIASVMVSWRLYLATGDVRYADLVERTSYNVVATSPAADGRAFFYANPLHQRSAGEVAEPDAVNPRAEGGGRAPWFEVSCCPTNLARTLATWQTGVASVDADGALVTLLQYAGGDLDVDLGGGGRLGLRVTTAYPVEGEVAVRVVEVPPRPVALRLRVPHWATGARLDRGADARPVAPGWVDVADLVRGEELVLHLPVEPRWTFPDRRVDGLRGTVAVERGPVVLCLESVDLPGGVEVEDVVVDTAAAPSATADGALVQLTAADAGGTAQALPYGSAPPSGARAATRPVPLVPYHRWAERGPSTMRVFLPTA